MVANVANPKQLFQNTQPCSPLLAKLRTDSVLFYSNIMYGCDIYGDEKDPPQRAFFDNKFFSLYLGTPGQWRGKGAILLNLESPMQLAEFNQVLNGRSPKGKAILAPDQMNIAPVRAWYCYLEASHDLSVLWALAPKQIRTKIESAHVRAVNHALCCFERNLGDRIAFNHWLGDTFPGTLFATFHHGASFDDQKPLLSCAVFVFNQLFSRDGSIGSFATPPAASLFRQAERNYHDMTGILLKNEMGIQATINHYGLLIDEVPSINLSCIGWQDNNRFCNPGKRLQHYFRTVGDPHTDENKAEYEEGFYKAVLSKQLFQTWSQIAAFQRWGPIEAEKLFQRAQQRQASERWSAKWQSRFHRAADLAINPIQKRTNDHSQSLSTQSKDDAHTHSR